MDKIVLRSLEDYATAKRADLPPRVQRLITLANHDLLYGPSMEGLEGEVTYPGFTEACRVIRDATEDIIQDVWVDIQAEYVHTSEPEPDVDGDDFTPVDWEDWAFVEARHLKYVFFGSELAPHI
jgi:hypothetical protein